MNSINHRVADLARDGETLYQPLKDRSLIFEPAKLQRHHRVAEGCIAGSASRVNFARGSPKKFALRGW
jgi:hypothetical protein